ncbi:MAG: alkaline phosphatase family protein [bacterium]|nr:alkaline phosphatase family protein [bacterium]
MSRLPVFASASLLVLALIGCVDRANEEHAAQVCNAVDEERFDEALRLSETGASARGAGRRIAECRCIAQLSTGDRAGCVALLDPLLREPAAHDWVPHPVLTGMMLRTWRATGVYGDGARLSRIAAERYPEHVDLLQLELSLRAQVEDEARVLTDIAERLDDDPLWTAQRVVLSLAWARRMDYARAVDVLGETPPAIDHRYALPWYEARIAALARDGDGEAVRATFADWRDAGWDPIDLQARYALRVSVDHLADPDHSALELLRDALEHVDAIQDRNVVWGLYRRLIGEYLGWGQPERALALYDVAIQRVPLEGITREEIERAVHRGSADYDPDALATLILEAPPEAIGGRWRLNPEPDQAPDVGYRAIPIDGEAPQRTTTRVGDHPTRWVLEDAEGRLRASGSAWPSPGAEIRIRAELASPTAAPTHSAATERAPADGRRRVFAILADCADWRLTEYLRARGDLPFQDHLFAEGHHAVLESIPAFTAAAMQALVRPAKPQAAPGAFARIHELGLELAGLESIGRNPVGFLSWILPERPDLFETLGAGPVVTANMLLTHGKLDVGRQAELIGPHGHREDLPAPRAYRALTPAERSRHPALDVGADTRKFAQTIAAEMDAAEAIAREGRVDFLFLRLEALDLLTHSGFSEIDGKGQDDGRGSLLSAYRYIDERLAALHALLDEDDWFVFLSDHGIRSAMQHEEDAIFVVVGEGVPAGRAEGKPALRGVPKGLAAMLGVPTPWPDTGAITWLEADDSRSEPSTIAAHR